MCCIEVWLIVFQDDLLAELEELEQEELEKDLLEVEPSSAFETDPLEELPSIRKFSQQSISIQPNGLKAR